MRNCAIWRRRYSKKSEPDIGFNPSRWFMNFICTWMARGASIGSAAANFSPRILDHTRKRIAAKRNSGNLAPLDGEAFLIPGPNIIQVDSALQRLARQHPRKAAVVELRFFGGLTAEETVEALNFSGRPQRRMPLSAGAFDPVLAAKAKASCICDRQRELHA
jgi:hypothetical protein